HCRGEFELIVTLNLPEPPPLSGLPFPVRLVENAIPKGFGENHNAAFRLARGEYFCVLNPDIRLTCDPFPDLIARLEASARPGVIAPRVVSPGGELEDSARPFPSPVSIVAKALGHNPDRDRLGVRLNDDALAVDWVAGMFMLFPRAVFAELGGFDERYFLYYEDVDLCSRLQAMGRDVRVSGAVSVIHDARRESHRNLRYLRWHLTSMLRFFIFHFLRRLKPSP
ncbi:MAG: glycosyltransferase, partial [Methylococcaceae bacterium]|nr:glycosyltransferase [Methylococcaceae bacterium]